VAPHRAMKWVSGSVTFVHAANVLAHTTGILAHGLTQPVATLCSVVGLLFGFAAYHLTERAPLRVRKPKPPPLPPEPKSKRAQRRAARQGKTFASQVPRWTYRSFWFWLLAACFAIFAVRSFCWLVYWDGNDVKLQSPNNLGDL